MNDTELQQLLAGLPAVEYEPKQLFDLVKPRSMVQLILVLEDLVRVGAQRRVFRVAGVDFENFHDLPGDAEPDQIKVIYQRIVDPT